MKMIIHWDIHICEHILMESNPKHTKNTWEEIEKKGIIANASTDNEIVDYTYMGSSKHWKTIFDLSQFNYWN